MVARFAVLAAELGGIGLSIEEIASEPESAAFVMAAMLMGVGGAGGGGAPKPRVDRYKDAADARRKLPSTALDSFPAAVKKWEESVQKIVSYCRWKR